MPVLKQLALVVLTMVAFAANSVLNRVAVAGGTDPVAFGALRLLSGALLLWMLFALPRRTRGARGAEAPVPATGARTRRLAGTGALLLYIFGFSAAYARLDTGLGALVLFACVQVTMFGGALLAGDSIPPRRWLGATIALAGLAVLLWPAGASAPSPGHAALMAAAGLGWGLYSLAGRGASDPLAETAANFAWATPAGLVLWLLSDARIDPGGAVLAILSGALASGLGYTLWYALLPRIAATTAALAQLTVPLIATAGGVLLLSEPVTWRFAVAAALVLGGLGVSLLRGRG